MTHKKDLKKRVRARQAETGQRYTEALRLRQCPSRRCASGRTSR